MREYLTNKLLQKLTLFPEEELFEKWNDSAHNAMEKAAEIEFNGEMKNAVLNYMMDNEELGKVYPGLQIEEKTIINKLLEIKFLHAKRKQVIKKVKKQQKRCLKFLRTDMCKRNKVLYEEVVNEHDKLRQLIKTDFISVSVNFLYFTYSEIYPEKNKRQKCVLVSERMRSLDLYKEVHFYTLVEANDIVDDPKSKLTCKDGEEYIYDFLKKYLPKGTRKKSPGKKQ